MLSLFLVHHNEACFWQRRSVVNQLGSDDTSARLASRNDTFLRDILSGENAVSSEDGASTVFPPITRYGGGRAAKMAALPAIYLPSLSRFQVKGMPRRVGGGFTSSSTNEPPRYSSAPTGLVEYMSLQGRPLDI